MYQAQHVECRRNTEWGEERVSSTRTTVLVAAPLIREAEMHRHPITRSDFADPAIEMFSLYVLTNYLQLDVKYSSAFLSQSRGVSVRAAITNNVPHTGVSNVLVACAHPGVSIALFKMEFRRARNNVREDDVLM